MFLAFRHCAFISTVSSHARIVSPPSSRLASSRVQTSRHRAAIGSRSSTSPPPPRSRPSRASRAARSIARVILPIVSIRDRRLARRIAASPRPIVVRAPSAIDRRPRSIARRPHRLALASSRALARAPRRDAREYFPPPRPSIAVARASFAARGRTFDRRRMAPPPSWGLREDASTRAFRRRFMTREYVSSYG